MRRSFCLCFKSPLPTVLICFHFTGSAASGSLVFGRFFKGYSPGVRRFSKLQVGRFLTFYSGFLRLLRGCLYDSLAFRLELRIFLQVH